MRGEYGMDYKREIEKLGSPPLARGILSVWRIEDRRGRITPACAGNTLAILDRIEEDRDHPRLRGEYPHGLTPKVCHTGSPPLARGILSG